MKVTTAMIDEAEKVHHEHWCGDDPDHPAKNCEGGMPRDLVRSMLIAAVAVSERSDARND